jgi:hypothetical protein
MYILCTYFYGSFNILRSARYYWKDIGRTSGSIKRNYKHMQNFSREIWNKNTTCEI